MTDETDRRHLRIASAQFDAEPGNVAANLTEHGKLLDEAGRQEVDLLVFPELSITGYASILLRDAPDRCTIDPRDAALDPLREACRRNGIAAMVGAPLSNARGLGLSALMLDRQGETCARYDKQHLDGHEKDWFVPGETGCMASLDGWRLGLGICYDASFPEHARGLAAAGAEIYLVSGAFPLGASDHRRSVYFPARALENTLYVAFANFVGGHDGLAYCGHSAVHGPDGRALADAGPDGPGLAVAGIDPERLRETRESLQMLSDRRGTPASIEMHEVD